jgi:erythromycin esterase
LELVAPIAPGVRGPTEQIIWYFQQPDKQPYIDAARATLEFVQGIQADGCQASHYDAVQHARAVVGWYEFYGLGQQRGPRDLFMADTVTDWQQRSGHNVIYWAANVHTAANSRITFTVPPDPTMTEVMTGSHLRARYGDRYVSIGTMFHEGIITTGWAQPDGPTPHVVGPPDPATVDATLGDARAGDYLIDLHAPASRPVRRWLEAPATLRLIAEDYDAANDAAHNMTVDSLSGGFDALLHLAHTTPTRLLDTAL